jgi:hypothetical protein
MFPTGIARSRQAFEENNTPHIGPLHVDPNPFYENANSILVDYVVKTPWNLRSQLSTPLKAWRFQPDGHIPVWYA